MEARSEEPYAPGASRAEKGSARPGKACAVDQHTTSKSSSEKQERCDVSTAPQSNQESKAQVTDRSAQESAALSSISARTAEGEDEAGRDAEKLQEPGRIENNPDEVIESILESHEGRSYGLQGDEDNPQEKRWWMQARVGSFRFRALYDNGASRICMGPIGLQLASALERQVMPNQGRGAKLADGSYTKIVGYVWLPFEVGNLKKEVRVAIVPDLPTDCIVGVNFMLTFKAILDPTTSKLHFKENKEHIDVELAAVEEGITGLASVGLADVEEGQREVLRALLDKIIGPDSGEIGCTSWMEHHIEVLNTRPIKQRYFPVSRKIEEEMHEQVRTMLAARIIEPSNSAFSSPVVMVRKANGKYRFCVDFRKVNAITRNDAYPLPNMNAILRKLQQARYISTIDLSSAYHQIPLSEESKQYTAFTVPGMGLFQFKRLPFGLSEAGATFQRLIDRVISPELQPHAFSYLDDVIVATETFEDHVKVLERVLNRIKEAGLTVNREKSVFGKEEVRYLGVLVNRDGFRPDPEKIAPIINFPEPKNLKQLRRFHGMASWYRQFLENYATLAEPLTRLTKKDHPFVWGEEQQTAFEAIKALVASAPILHCPHFDQQFVIETDASDTGLGVVLTQRIDGLERVLEFASRVLTPAERNYTVSERECLAVLFAVRKFRQYIEGYEFKVITDHSSLRWLYNLRNPTGRLARWALELQGHKYTIEHRKGADHHVPDALSRVYEEAEPTIASVSQDPQPLDRWYNTRYQAVEEKPENFPEWKIVGGRMYKYKPDPDIAAALGNDDDSWKLVIPEEKRTQVLQECHDQPTAGHFGREKTYRRVIEKYFWPRVYRDVARYVQRCRLCQLSKVEQRALPGFMGKRVVQRPWQWVAGDIIGPLPRSTKGNEYALVFQDLFTRWVECIPLRKANGRAILAALKERVILRFGAPEVFHSDNGTEFKNKLIDEYLTAQGIRHSYTPPYHPQANPVERVNRTVKREISTYAHENHRTWDEFLNEIAFSCNTAVHESTGATPAMLNFGRQPVMPASLRREEDQQAAARGAVDEWQARLENLPKLHERAKALSGEAQDRQAAHYNARRRPAEFKVGDMVSKRRHVLSSAAEGIAAKLAFPRIGPYKITARVGSNTFELTNSDGKVEKLVPAEELKYYYGSEEESPDDEDGTESPREPACDETRRDPSEASELEQRLESPAVSTRGSCERRQRSDCNVKATTSENSEPRDAAESESSRRPRGRPRKIVTASAPSGIVKAVKRKPGRPKGSTRRVNPENTVLSPRRTRAQRCIPNTGISHS